MPKLNIIAAVADNNVIGSKNDLLWYLPEDLKRFKKLTLGQAVLMGQKTFESIIARLGKPLPERKNIVVTNDASAKFPEGVIVLHNLEEIDQLPDEEIFICGGGSIYTQLIGRATKLYLTHVHQTPAGDIFFPKVDWSQWKKTFSEEHDGFEFAEYEKII